MNGATPVLLRELDAIVLRHCGRIYLAKDAGASPQLVREGYPRRERFETIRAEAAGEPPRFASALSQRLAL